MKTVLQTTTLVVVLLIITAIPAWAGQGVGTSPYTADLLVSGLNTGELSPGQEYWYAYSRLDLGDPSYNSIILSLNFEAEGRAIASRVNFQVFDFPQVEQWLANTSGPVNSLGLGTPASADFDVNTGERLWAGPISSNEVYYVRIFNLSPSPVQFRLTALGQKSIEIDEFLTGTTPVSVDQPVIPAASVNGPTTTKDTIIVPEVDEFQAPSAPEPVIVERSLEVELPAQPDESPFSTSWLLAAQAIDGLPPSEAAAWLMSAATLGWLPSGTSSPSLVPIDPNAGQVTTVVNEGGGEEVAETVAEPVAAPDASKGESIYPNQPLRLLQGMNTGRMSPKTEQWYTFTAGTVDQKTIEEYSLTMFFTPGEPNLARNVTFEMFTADQYHIWERGTPKDMVHFGAGQWVSRDGDYITGERLWHGTVVDGGKYFVKISNNTNKWIDYHLVTGDIYNIELGPIPESQKVTARRVETSPTGKDIGSPLPIGKGHQIGQLEAGEDVWFQYEHRSFNDDTFEFDSYLIELDHTPGHGNVTNYVNVEIYPYQEQHIWQRGDTDLIRPLGAGSDLAYDEDTDTHTWVWDGHLVSNTIYFIRVKNDSTQAIDYDLFIQRR